jgi:NAD(P)-dependent dehydrogenase (short-subunit alcohol dehydrogenase family)
VVVNDLGAAPDGSGHGSGAADATVAEIRAAGGEAVASYDSVATAEGGAAIVQAALDAYDTVDIVINNAGQARPAFFGDLSAEDVKAVVDVHLMGAFHVTQPAFRVMQDVGYGRLLFTSSAAGLFGLSRNANYSAAKAGVVGLAHTLALEGARFGITANVIAPIAQSRLTDPLMIPALEGLLEADLVMPLALYLVSARCSLTHEVFSVGGGRFARVFSGLSPGWFAGRGARPSVEDVADHLDEIRSEAGYSVPGATRDDVAALLDVLETSQTR